ncbi:MAG: HrcA family transcriptional regulator, partial [Lachnospiraceae bacterium]|nr:HrcA family transcriptional regulator [Lachnospiraceae bacterium]
MNLDERKKKILKTIIRTYLSTGEPVGSRTISKDPEMSVSSATIRNEMVDLEEMGYIAQPHTSAGRIPTDKGYRFYVDELMAENDQKIIDMRTFMEDRLERVETVLKLMADMISQKT